MKPLRARQIANFKQDRGTMVPGMFEYPRRVSGPPLTMTASWPTSARPEGETAWFATNVGSPVPTGSSSWSMRASHWRPEVREEAGRGCVALSWCFAPYKLTAVGWMPSLCWESTWRYLDLRRLHIRAPMVTLYSEDPAGAERHEDAAAAIPARRRDAPLLESQVDMPLFVACPGLEWAAGMFQDY